MFKYLFILAKRISENEKKEIDVISTFLPKQLSEEDTKKIRSNAIF